MTPAFSADVERFREDYAAQRAAEGRGYAGEDLLRLPYLRQGPLGRQWRVRASTFAAFIRHVIRPILANADGPVSALDLGSGNGWLSYRLSIEGLRCTAIDIRDDGIDGLAAAEPLVSRRHFDRLTASFDAVPLPACAADLVIFNASLHYATDLGATLAEAARLVRPGGTIAILDSPFYRRAEDGEAMIAEKHAAAPDRFGARAATLLSLPFIEYLTADRLREVSMSLGITWRRRRVIYPLWYEMRPLTAWLRGRRAPSRFDIWTARR